MQPTRPHTRGKSIAAAFLAALFTAPAFAAVDACKLLTADQVQAATKVKVSPPAPDTATSAMVGKCKFPHADKSFGSSPVASVAAFRPDRIATQKTMWTQFMKLKPVPGVGDYAYFQEMTGVLFVGIGSNKAVQVQVLDGPRAPAARLEALKTLARQALAKL